MSDDIEDAAGDEEQKPLKKVAKHDSGAADLEKVTDYAEDKEIRSQDIMCAMSLIGDRHSKETAEKAARQKELAKVVIKKEDVELIAVLLSSSLDDQRKLVDRARSAAKATGALD
ncbi:huntingtin-interacting protein K [Ixodes scapularis]